MANILIAFLLAAVLALSVISVLFYVQTTNSHTIDRDDVFSAFREHALYKEFKTMYPDSVDSEYSRDIYMLDSTYTKGDDKLILQMIFDPETYSSFYAVMCSTDRHIRAGGAAYFDAHEYLHDNDCIVGDGPPPLIPGASTVRSTVYRTKNHRAGPVLHSQSSCTPTSLRDYLRTKTRGWFRSMPFGKNHLAVYELLFFAIVGDRLLALNASNQTSLRTYVKRRRDCRDRNSGTVRLCK